MDAVALTEKKLGYAFANKALLQTALTHPSATPDNLIESYERLEFLGDAVLDIFISESLYNEYPEEAEGALAKRRSALVCKASLAIVSKEIGLDECIILGLGEDNSGGRENDANLENVLEAAIGAVYLDSNLKTTVSVFHPFFDRLIHEMKEPPKDAKTTLQEWAQSRALAIPHYRLVEQTGPAHEPVFVMEVSVKGFEPITAEGSNKKAAEQIAADLLLAKIGTP